MEVKVKTTTFGNVRDNYLEGFKALRYDSDRYRMTYGNILGEMPTEFHIARIYLKRLNVTYVAVTCIGFIYLCGPKTDDPTWVLRYEGDYPIGDIKEDEHFTAALQEAAKVYRTSYDARKEEES